MTRSVRIHEFGDANVLRIEDVEVFDPQHVGVAKLMDSN